MAVFKGASDDMYVGQRSLQVQKQMDTFFKFAPEATIDKALELNFISLFRLNIFVFDMRCKLFLG